MDSFNAISFQREENKHLISFIIPVYKDYTGLQRTVRSIRKQTVTGYTIEIIVVNDGGDKEVKNVCQQEKVKMVEVIPNSGSYYARNRGLEHSAGQFIAFIDADVYVPQGWLTKALEKLGSYLYLAGEVDIDKKGNQGITQQFEIYNSFPIKTYFETEHFGVTAGILVRRQLIEKVGGFDQRLRSSGDREFGKKVYDSMGKQAQVYLDSPALIHPPRTLHQFLKKIKRIKKGEVLLHHFYPQRFPKHHFFKNLWLFILSWLPPRPGRVQEYFPGEDRYPFFKKWMFLWILKIYDRYYTLVSWLVHSYASGGPAGGQTFEKV